MSGNSYVLPTFFPALNIKYLNIPRFLQYSLCDLVPKTFLPSWLALYLVKLIRVSCRAIVVKFYARIDLPGTC